MIRAATASDFEAMDALFRASVKTLCATTYSAELIDAWAGTPRPERFVKGRENGDISFVYVTAPEIAGFAVLNCSEQALVALFVSPQHAGQGVGKALLAHLEAHARASGIDRLTLSASLNALPFYQQMGYVEQRRELFRTYSGAMLDSVVMEKRLC